MENLDEAATVATTQVKSEPRIEIVAERRRTHGPAFRERVLAQAAAPGSLPALCLALPLTAA
jgi:hypothetical protein